MRPLKWEESNNLQLISEYLQKNLTPNAVGDECRILSSEEEFKRNNHIQELIDELDYNRTGYEKLLNDHAEKKQYWMNYIKQLEAKKISLYGK